MEPDGEAGRPSKACCCNGERERVRARLHCTCDHIRESQAKQPRPNHPTLAWSQSSAAAAHMSVLVLLGMGSSHLRGAMEDFGGRQDQKTTLPGKAFSFLHLRRGGGTSPDGRPSRGRTTYSLKQNKKLNKRPHNSKPTS